MKQIFTLIVTALLLCATLTPSVFAAQEPSISTESETTVTDENTNTLDGTGDISVPDGFDYTGSVISFTTPDFFGDTLNMACGDTCFTQIHSALDSVDLYSTVEKDGTSYSLSLSVTWDFSTVDAQTPGTYTAIGSIFIPEGAMLSDGLDNTVSISIQVASPELLLLPPPITLIEFDEPNRVDAVAFAVGTTQEKLSKWFADSVAGFTGYDSNGNSYDLISGKWSLDTVDTVAIGVYYASVAPNLGAEYTLADGVSLCQQLCAVSIQTPGEPDINCCVSGRGFLHFPWVLSAEQQKQLDEFAVWLRQDAGQWTNLSDGFCFTSEDFQLSQSILAYGSTYELKITYPGGQTGILSFQYDGELSILDYSGGDRDGGDSQNNGNHNSDNNTQVLVTDKPTSDAHTIPIRPIEFAAPVYSDTSLSYESEGASSEERNYAASYQKDGTKTVIKQVPDGNNTTPEENYEPQEPTVVSESYSPTQTIISGLRLRDLCTNEKNVVFGSGDLTVSILSSPLLALNLSDSDTLSVSLTQPESNQILIAVEASGKPVTELIGTVLRLQYMPQSENTEITVLNESGKQITDASYDGKLLSFTADAMGTYTIFETSNTQKIKKGVSPLLPVSGGLILVAGAITFFMRRRHG